MNLAWSNVMLLFIETFLNVFVSCQRQKFFEIASGCILFNLFKYYPPTTGVFGKSWVLVQHASSAWNLMAKTSIPNLMQPTFSPL